MIIDYRETEENHDWFASNMPHEYSRGALEFGDVFWEVNGRSYGIELKSMSDAIGSFWSHKKGQRLERQLAGLRSSVDRPFLAIYGAMARSNKTWLINDLAFNHSKRKMEGDVTISSLITPKQFDGFLFSAMFPDDGAGINVLWRPNKRALFGAIQELFEWSHKPDHNTFTKPQRPVRMKGNDSRSVALSVLMAIKGIGLMTAEKLLKEYESIKWIVLADEKDLRKKFGKVTAERLKAAFGTLTL